MPVGAHTYQIFINKICSDRRVNLLKKKSKQVRTGALVRISMGYSRNKWHPLRKTNIFLFKNFRIPRLEFCMWKIWKCQNLQHRKKGEILSKPQFCGSRLTCLLYLQNVQHGRPLGKCQEVLWGFAFFFCYNRCANEVLNMCFWWWQTRG